MTKSSSYTVHKFGGSSFSNHTSYETVASRLSGTHEIIVVSAINGVTSSLQALLDKAVKNEPFHNALAAIADKHIAVINNLIDHHDARVLIERLQKDIADIKDLLHTAALLKEYSPYLKFKVIGYGEQWSAEILTIKLNETNCVLYLNATDVLFTYKKNRILYIDWPKSTEKIKYFLKAKHFDQLVITGFLASDEQGRQIILGRNASDYSAAIFSKLFQAKELILWKDVDGIFTADPTRVRSAFPIDNLSYKSTLELAYFGGSIIHPKTITPAMELGIPIYIKNTLNPEAPGTKISSSKTLDFAVQGISSIDHIALITIEGTGLIGVSGTAVRVFHELHELDISVILISQASSEHSICFAVELPFADDAVNALKNAFEFEIRQNQIERISADKNSAILAVVGDGMVGKIGMAGKLMATLARSNINIKAIAQGASEHNISIVVARDDTSKALRAVHSGFYLSDKTLSIGIIGPGLVGRSLLNQIGSQLRQLQQQHHVKLLVRGICNSKKMYLSHQGIDLDNWEQLLKESTLDTDLTQFSDYIIADDIPHAVIIDCTASAHVAKQYTYFMDKGAHIITPNKRANAGDYQTYQALKTHAQKDRRHYLYETTVCAGLPIITTLGDIIQTGDEVLKIEGVVSGTLSYIFSELTKGLPFSSVIREAKSLGYTEPDPREDLSGMDVARKVVILARELGHPVNLSDVIVHNLVPEQLTDCDIETFLEELPKYDEALAQTIKNIVKPDERAAYVGVIKQDGSVEVGIRSFPLSNPIARLKGTDNMLIFHTKRYYDLPLVIQGPGAGAEVTAAGVFADLLRLVSLIAN